MPSGMITTIRLDPFYQQFLRAQFNQHEPLLIFRKAMTWFFAWSVT